MKVLIICIGLGRIKRGFEITAEQLYHELVKKNVNVCLAQGVFHRDKKRFSVPHFHRFSKIAKFIYKHIPSIKPNLVEEFSYFISLVPFILFLRPDVIYFTERRLGNALYHFKRIFSLKYQLIFSNGAPLHPSTYKSRSDLIQQKLYWVFEEAINYGVAKEKMMLVSNGFYLQNNGPDENSKSEIRKRYNIPLEKNVILSVAAINKYHKRIDYLINECKPLLKRGNYILICLGQLEEESEEIIQEHKDLIENGCLIVSQVSSAAIGDYYRMADVFVHTSLFEGFGRVIVEAQSFGLPCVLHNFDGFKDVAGPHAIYTDMQLNGALEKSLELIVDKRASVDSKEISQYAKKKYDWMYVIDDYIKMFEYAILNK